MSKTTNPVQPGSDTVLYGVWNPVKNEPDSNGRRWMEWWASETDAFQSMRDRLSPTLEGRKADFATGNQCLARHVYQQDRPDAQFYGSRDASCILLYERPDAEQPSEIIDFGPRGALRRSPYTLPTDDAAAAAAPSPV
ncbi:hypothetical protein [Streptomyces scabiei]|uniref:hypothetical protein n=1 Tax=Streptomyces scabiei TaxID=1930 RepID=UPI0029A1743E|nr:hypothetical protein [Streptomyces scabiei]MDX2800132.1 hypothetical protein [Streptomyces scabiei]MDX3127786.1 hypothetical protein [Streptomyces scabiei]MDX3280152.1 hypothetical protein [Streptomyces scabiei]MDX3280156.1 hypothetical protein [Streptomyces scabiei]